MDIDGNDSHEHEEVKKVDELADPIEKSLQAENEIQEEEAIKKNEGKELIELLSQRFSESS